MSEAAPQKAVPAIDPGTEPYWEGALQGELRLQRCTACGAYRHPAAEVCPRCLSAEFDWVAASGRGTVYSFVIVRQALNKAWEADVPYCVAIVALEEGPHFLSNLTGIAVNDIAIDLPVEVYFEPVREGVTLPKFRPAP
jgi:uncharacterized OB-fold protein